MLTGHHHRVPQYRRLRWKKGHYVLVSVNLANMRIVSTHYLTERTVRIECRHSEPVRAKPPRCRHKPPDYSDRSGYMAERSPRWFYRFSMTLGRTDQGLRLLCAYSHPSAREYEHRRVEHCCPRRRRSPCGPMAYLLYLSR